MARLWPALGPRARVCLGALRRRSLNVAGAGAGFSPCGGWRNKVSFAAVLDKAESVMPCYAMVQQKLRPEVIDAPKAANAGVWGHSLRWSWGSKEIATEGTGRSKKIAKNAAARELLKRLVNEEQELMDPTNNGALAQWAIEWINQSLQASMELQEEENEGDEEDTKADASYTCTWSCPQLEGETVVRATARTAAKSRWQAMANLYQELPQSVEQLLAEVGAEPTPRLLQPEAWVHEEGLLSQISMMHNMAVQRLGVRCQTDCTAASKTRFKCRVQWTLFDNKEQQMRSVMADGTGRSKAVAKARANAEVLASEGHLPQMTDDFLQSVARLRQALNENRFDAALADADVLMEAPEPGPTGWSFFLPEVLRAVLAEGDSHMVSGLIASALRNLEARGGAPLELWEALLDEAAFSLRHYRRASWTLEQLAEFPLAEDAFPTSQEAEYFQRFRHLLALERHGGLMHGIQQYELDPQMFCTVPTVDVHQLAADRVVLTTAPGSVAVDLVEGSRPLKSSDLVLLVPLEVVPELSGSQDEPGEGEIASSGWQHPQAWLATITSLSGNPRSGEELRISTRRISRFGSDAEEAAAPLTLGRQYRLFSISMETPLQRMLSALRCLCRASLPVWSDNYIGRKPSFSYTEELRRALVGMPEEARAFASEPVRVMPGTPGTEEAMEQLLARRAWCVSLTPSQRDAVKQALVQRLSLIQGPPGTGKTFVACAIIAAWVDRYASSGQRILAVADSNVAADNLQTRLQAFGVDSVRVGHGREVEATKGDQLWQLVRSAQVIIATCIGSGMEVLDTKGSAGQFQRVVIDECTQACEPAALVALGRQCEQAVLIGDHRQLPATVLSKLAQRDGLGVSLFERMVDNGIAPTVLLEQRRMHSSIAEFPNRAFYAGQLVNAVDDAALDPVPGFPWPNPDCRVCFVDVTVKLGEAAEGKRGYSTFNVSEAHAVADVVSEVLSAGVKPQDLCVLTAYVAQRIEILRALRDRGLRHELPQLSVETVDGYQGMERNLVLFSATRSNAERSLGFLSDARRMNVMLTRARRGLIVFGNCETLRSGRSSDSRWQAWLDWVREKGVILPSSAIAEHRAGLSTQGSRGVSPAVAPSAPGFAQPPRPVGGTAAAADGDFAGEQGARLGGAEEADAGGGTPMPPPPPAASQSPAAQWHRVYSSEYGQHYFWDKVSNKTQWEPPPGFES